ncbi:MAG: tetratricopeptide repeat protein [Bacteroidetes bacterium]|nr:tetratricopeptide repeat protein [Bacteroidota bacterium]
MKHNNIINWTLKQLLVAVFCVPVLYAQEPKSRDDWQTFVKIARKAYAEKDYQKALLYYQNATLKAPPSFDLTNELAQTHYRLNQLEQAKGWYEKSKNEATAEFNKGNVAYKQKDYQKSIDHYKNALRKNPGLPEAQMNLSMAMKEMKKNPPPPPTNKPQKNTPPKPQNQENNPDESPSDSNQSSGLSDKSIERLLNQLSKSEAETKRKINSGGQKSTSTKSEKNW